MSYQFLFNDTFASHQRKVVSPLRFVAEQVKVASSPAVRVGVGARATEEGGSGGGVVQVGVEWWW